ncbi:unnamed protein product [Lepeophtheirus salmonis]|uniref:Transmembrane protein 198 n=1 Tax=Lepeophtheirus salmonis TaxID=72036 RepID=A0A7R8CEW3_LEPSM|nr:unnamed protein product [Lepeophtheirus salmonis]CAF2799057.1 unnamed protein product [Lepeophtheirus salmonis]
MFPGIGLLFWDIVSLRPLCFSTDSCFGSLIVILIILAEEGSEESIPRWGITLIGLGAGFLLGTITLLIQYVGIFILGFIAGVLAGIASLSALQYSLIYIPTSPWICVVVLLLFAVSSSLANLCFQKSLTIVCSSFYGAAIISATLDYFIEHSVMLFWLWDKIKITVSPEPSWYSWLLLATWPSLFILGFITQILVTGKGTYHERPFERKSRSNPETREERKQRKYRYLYQVRTCHGDVISQPVAKKYVHQVNDESFA